MKRVYEKPMFYAEAYTFNESIAKCDIDIDTTPPLDLVCGTTNMCTGKINDDTDNAKEDGHTFGGHKGPGVCGGAGTIHTELGHKCGTAATIFNGDGCTYDWDGRTNIVAQTGDNFAESFYGTDSDVKNHAPGYNGKTFLS